MTTEEIIEKFLEEGRRAFKVHTAKKSPELRKLIRHEAVMIDGTEYNYLQEVVVVKTAEYIKTMLPDCDIEVILDGNNSTLNLTLTDEEQAKLTGSLYSFLKKHGCI